MKKQYALKYIDKTYSSAVYDSEEEFEEAQKLYIKEVQKKGIYGEDDYNQLIYDVARHHYESSKMFDRAVESTGDKLWKGKAWHDEKCMDKCPLRELCKDKKLFENNGKKYCYGQIYIDKEGVADPDNNVTPNIICFIFEEYIYYQKSIVNDKLCALH